jgi:hypothetical protein
MPTSLGIEFLNLMWGIKEFSDLCIKVRTKLNRSLEILDTADKKVISMKLKQEGWSKEDIDSFEHIKKSSFPIRFETSPTTIIEMILQMYVSLLSKLIVDNNNEFAKSLLNRIIMNAISDQLSVLMESVDVDKIDQRYSGEILNEWNAFIASVVRTRLLHYQFLKNEIKEMSLAKFRTFAHNDKLIGWELGVMKNQANVCLRTKKGEQESRDWMAFVSLCEEAYNKKLT